MSLINNFPSYVKASWLADLEIDQFLTLTKEEITLAIEIYHQLDEDYFKTVDIATYGDRNFLIKSDQLDCKTWVKK